MSAEYLKVNEWLIDNDTGDLWMYDASLANTIVLPPMDRLEPQSSKLLFFLAQHANQIVSKQQLITHLWENSFVTDDALARCISRLRKSLEDDPKLPRLIETLPKRGYRLIAADVEWPTVIEQGLVNSTPRVPPNRMKIVSSLAVFVVFVLAFVALRDYLGSNVKDSADDALIGKADDYYIQMRRQDNEMAIELYQQAIALKPESGQGLAGLANALVQQVIRWPNPATEHALTVKNLEQALNEGRHLTPKAVLKLDRALALAQQSVALSPNQARGHKALGFVYSAQQQFDLAIVSYKRAVEIDADAWDALINLGDVSEINDDIPNAIHYYELAFDAMGRVYAEQTARIHPWYADLGAVIGDRYRMLQRFDSAEVWYRRVLAFAPFNALATNGLAIVLLHSGDDAGARRLCDEFIQRVGKNACADALSVD